MLCHDSDQLGVAGFLGVPAQDRFGLGGVTPKVIHVCGPEPGLVDGYKQLSRSRVIALFVNAGAFPADGHAVGGEGLFGEIPDGMLLAGGDDKVIRLLLLQNQPHALYIVLGVAPVPEGIHIAQLQVVLEALGNAARGQSDLPGDKVLAPALGFVVKEDAVDGKHAIGLPVFLDHPEAVLLGHGVGGIGMEGRGFPLGDLLHLAEKLRGGSLIDAALRGQAADAHRFQNPQHSQSVNVSGILRHIKGHLHVALGRQIVNFIGLHQGNDPDQAGGIRQVSVVEGDFV